MEQNSSSSSDFSYQYGYTCPYCGQFVASGEYHSCEQMNQGYICPYCGAYVKYGYFHTCHFQGNYVQISQFDVILNILDNILNELRQIKEKL